MMPVGQDGIVTGGTRSHCSLCQWDNITLLFSSLANIQAGLKILVTDSSCLLFLDRFSQWHDLQQQKVRVWKDENSRRQRRDLLVVFSWSPAPWQERVKVLLARSLECFHA